MKLLNVVKGTAAGALTSRRSVVTAIVIVSGAAADTVTLTDGSGGAEKFTATIAASSTQFFNFGGGIPFEKGVYLSAITNGNVQVYYY